MDYLKFWSMQELKQDKIKEKNFNFIIENDSLNPFADSNTENLKDNIPRIAENKKDVNSIDKPRTIINNFVNSEIKILRHIKPKAILLKSRKSNFFISVF